MWSSIRGGFRVFAYSQSDFSKGKKLKHRCSGSDRTQIQTSGEPEGLLSCSATETRSFVCIGVTQLQIWKKVCVYVLVVVVGGGHSQLWLQSEQLLKTSKSRATRKTFLSRLQVKHTVSKVAFRGFQCALRSDSRCLAKNTPAVFISVRLILGSQSHTLHQHMELA